MHDNLGHLYALYSETRYSQNLHEGMHHFIGHSDHLSSNMDLMLACAAWVTWLR
jgi:hypothetical protein